MIFFNFFFFNFLNLKKKIRLKKDSCLNFSKFKKKKFKKKKDFLSISGTN